MKQTDTFQSDDSVVWADPPWPIGHRDRKKKLALLQQMKSRMGSGPFVVETVVPITGRDEVKAALHSQWLILQGFPDKISGVFFNKAG